MYEIRPITRPIGAVKAPAATVRRDAAQQQHSPQRAAARAPAKARPE
jgi:hypothetical protein